MQAKPEIKVPEGVLKRFCETAENASYGTLAQDGSFSEALSKALTAALEQLVEEMLGDEALRVAKEAEARWHRADTPDTEAISLVEYVLKAVCAHVLGGSE